MKPTPSPLLRAALGLAFALLATIGKGATNPTVPAQPKDHAMYLGANFAVEWKGALRPVVGVENSAFIVDLDGHRTVVPTFAAKNLRIKMNEELKVSAKSATLKDYKAERAYTPENDPQRLYGQTAQLAAGASTLSDHAMVKLNQLESLAGLQAHMQGAAGGSGTGAGGVTPDQIADARADMLGRFQDQSSAINTMGDAGSRVTAEEARELYDAFRLTFEVSAPSVLAKPYVVIVARIREKPDKPETARLWIYAQELERVDEKPRKFYIMRGGFPKGYQLESVKLHLYDQGVEVATNEAPNRVMITADEAFQFGVIDYIEAHRGATLAAEPLKAALPAGVRARLAAAQLSRTYFVKVSKIGLPVAAFADEACKEKISDSDLKAALATLRFDPALKEGKPVESVLPVRLEAWTN